MSYTSALEAIQKRLDSLTVITPEVGGALLARLDMLAGQQGETNNLLRAMNGRIRENSQAVAAHTQFITDHEEVHKTQDARVDYVSRKTNVAAVMSSGVAAVGAFLGFTKGG